MICEKSIKNINISIYKNLIIPQNPQSTKFIYHSPGEYLTINLQGAADVEHEKECQPTKQHNTFVLIMPLVFCYLAFLTLLCSDDFKYLVTDRFSIYKLNFNTIRFPANKIS